MIEDIEPRAPQLGRIRCGKKSAKGQPVKLTKFRFTSHDEVAIKEVAALYGGEPHQWADAPEGEQWEVETEASAIDVLVPPDPMSAFYERWSAAGVARRCTGQTCTMVVKGEMVDEPCVCKAKGWTPGDEDDVNAGACDLVSRFNVLLPNVSGLGVWRLDTGSVFGYKELAGQVALLRRMSGSMLDIPAQLCIEQRKIKRPGQQVRQFIVPVLRVRRTLNELVTAARSGEALTTGDQPEHPRELESSRPSTIGDKPAHVQQVVYACSQHGVSKADAEVLCSHFSGRRTTSRKDLNLGEAGAMIAVIVDGSWEAIVTSERDAVVADRADGEPAEPTAAEPSQPTLEDAAAKADVGMPDALRKAWNAFAMLPVELKQEGQKYLLDHDFPDDWRLLTPEHIAELVELVDSLCMEAESPAASGTAPAEGETWDADQWTTAAKAAGVTGPKTLTQARALARELGVDLPKSLGEITDESVASRLRSWLDEMRGAA